MGKCFNGFDGFDCREYIWWGVFRANAHGGSKRLRELLSIPADWPEAVVFARKLRGDNAWTNEADAFLAYSEDPEEYRLKWREQWAAPPGCAELFRRFIASVPAETSDPEQARFLPAARKVCAYLEQVLPHCGDGGEEWPAAGMYALTAFFLQNSKSAVPRLYRPPLQHDPVDRAPETVVVPDVTMAQPEDPECRVDFLEQYYRRAMRNSADKKKKTEAPKGSRSGKKPSPKIRAAEIHRKREFRDDDFTIIEGQTCTRAFLLDYYLFRADRRWREMCRLQAIPFEEEQREGKPARRFLLHGERFADEDVDGITVSALLDGSKALLNTFVFTADKKLYVSKRSTRLELLRIDENGCMEDAEVENLLEFCNFSGTVRESSPARWKRSSSRYKPEYLQYLLLNAETMEELPRSFGRDPATGEYRLNVMLPCPGKLVGIWVTLEDEDDAEEMAVTGYLHGLYGLKKDPDSAKRLMKDGAEEGDPRMAFQYGALLRRDGEREDAEKYLRMGAEDGIPGARFELAELLRERGTEETLAEAAELTAGLLADGYRTYAGCPVDPSEEAGTNEKEL